MPNDELKQERQRRAVCEIDGFRAALGPFVTAADTTRMPMIFTDAKTDDNSIIYVNEAFLAMTGHDEDEVIGQSFDFLMERGTDPEMLAEIRTSFEGGRGLEPLVRFRRKHGGAVWVSIFIMPVRNRVGILEQHFASFIDITRQKEEKDRLRALFDRP